MNYSEDDLARGLKLIETGMPATKAAAAVGVPLRNLMRRKANPEIVRKHGRPLAMSTHDEDQLVKSIKIMAGCAKPVTVTWARMMAARFVGVRGKSFKDKMPTTGWWQKFAKRHPDIKLRTPSLLNAGRKSMSRASVMDRFYKDASSYLEELGLLDQPDRTYNIDESWVGSKDEGKKNKVLIPTEQKMPYLVKFTPDDHITITLCISASGSFLPTMFTFAKSIPQGDKFLREGPTGALYNVTESGHINSALYLQYLQHIEPSLNPVRPVVIFQDNCMAHESLDLVEFCVRKGIHLINFPSKVTHLIQPLDKLFGEIKNQLSKKEGEGSQVVESVNRAMMPVLLRFALEAVPTKNVKSAFEKTGICPLNRSKITADVLVGDYPAGQKGPQKKDAKATTILKYESVHQPALNLGVFDDDGSPIAESSKTSSMMVQTDPVGSLPCTSCLQNDVTLHPAVRANLVDVELATALYGQGPKESDTQSDAKPKIKRRDYSKGKRITAESELQRLREAKEEMQRKEEEKKEKQEKTSALKELKQKEEEEKQHRKAEKKREQEAIVAQTAAEKASIRASADERKRQLVELHENAKKKRKMCVQKRFKSKGVKCSLCSYSIHESEVTHCVLCGKTQRRLCAELQDFDKVAICPACRIL